MDDKAKKKKKKRRAGLLDSRFYRIYFAAVGAALVAVAIGLVWLNGVVKDYELAQPAHAAEEVARLFEEEDYARIYSLDTAAQAVSGGDEAFYVQSLEALADGKDLTWRESFSTDADERRYTVSLDGDKLATFTLVPSGQTTRHGNRLWKLGSLTTNIALQGTEEAGVANDAPWRASAPDGYTVSVDGRALTDDDVVETGGAILPEGFAPAGVSVPTMTTYAFFSDSADPQVTAVDASGAEAEVVRDGDASWTCPLKEDAQLREQYAPAIAKLAERIALYTVKDLSRSAVLGNVAEDSPAETIIRQFSNDWAPTHKTATVTDAKVTDFHVLSDDCFTCHVDFTFTLRTRRGNDYVYPTSYTFCVIRRNGEGKLYNLTFN